MALTNQSKPTTTFTNVSKVASYETWDTITTTWDTETRTWDDMGSLFTNVAVDRTGLSLWASTTYPWTLNAPWLTTGGMTNVSKPA